jgi:hypothetical protein
MDRKLINTQVTLSVVYEIDGTGTNPSPDTATVTVTRADGTAIVTDAAATNGANGLFTYTIDAVDNDRLDILTAAWTSDLGTLSTVTEIVGGFLFTISELQAQLTSDQVSGSYTVEQIVATRTLVEDALEDACGVAFVPRLTTETLSGTGTTDILLRPRVRTVRTVTIDGEDQTLTDLTYSTTGLVYWPDRWTAGTSNLTVAYEHGYDRPPERVKRAAMLLAKSWLIASPIDDRTSTFSSVDGGTYSLMTPGLRGVMFGLPEVEATVQQYSLHAGVA